MLDRQLMISARNRPLEQAPDVFNAVRMNVATDILFGLMVDDLMLRIVICNPAIGIVIIRDNDFCIGSRMVINKPMQRLPICSINDLQPILSASLNHADDDALVFHKHSLSTSTPAQASADKSFIHFDSSFKGRR